MLLETISIILATVNGDSPDSSGDRRPQERVKRINTAIGTSQRQLTGQHIGRMGELLVQYELLRLGIDSSPMTTDSGIDLVAYSPDKRRSFTIQVKANLAPKPGGGKGAPAIDWWVDEDCPAEWIAFVDISTRRVWMLRRQELDTIAQQRSNRKLHLYMYTDPDAGPRAYERNGDSRFSEYLFEKRISILCNGNSKL